MICHEICHEVPRGTLPRRKLLPHFQTFFGQNILVDRVIIKNLYDIKAAIKNSRMKKKKVYGPEEVNNEGVTLLPDK